MEYIRKCQKSHEEDRKQIKVLTSEKQKLNKKLQILFEENRALRELAKMPLDDEMARSVAERELVKEEAARINNKKKYFE